MAENDKENDQNISLKTWPCDGFKVFGDPRLPTLKTKKALSAFA